MKRREFVSLLVRLNSAFANLKPRRR